MRMAELGRAGHETVFKARVCLSSTRPDSTHEHSQWAWHLQVKKAMNKGVMSDERESIDDGSSPIMKRDAFHTPVEARRGTFPL